MLNVTKEKKEDVLTVSLEGDLDSTTAPALENELKEVVETVPAHLVFDLAKLNYVSSAGLRVFLSTQKKIRGKAEMKIVNSVKDVMEIFEVTGFVDILDIE